MKKKRKNYWCLKIRSAIRNIDFRYIRRNGAVLFCSILKKIRRKVIERKNGIPIPASVFIYITQECNLECEGCISSGYSKTSSMTSDLLERTIFECLKLSINSIIILGGEPMLETPLSQILTLMENSHKLRRTNFNIVTNGTTIDNKLIQKLIKHPNLLLFISLDGSEATHNLRRGVDSYKKTKTAMLLLKSHGIPFITITTVSRQNYCEILDSKFVSLCLSLGSVGMVFLPYLVSGCDKDNLFSLTLKEWKNTVRGITKLKDEYPDVIIADIFSDEMFFSGCRAATRSIAIATDGSVQVCPVLMVAADKLNNENTLLECLKSPFFSHVRAIKKKAPRECLIMNSKEELQEYIKEAMNGVNETSDTASIVLEQGFTHYISK